jgi:putative transcriptional regulator
MTFALSRSLTVAARKERVHLALLILTAAVGSAQTIRTGQLLIATTASHDSDFARTVVLIVQSDAQGVAGLFLNRPTDADILKVLPELTHAPAGDKTVYAGGPLALGINALVRSRTRPAEGHRVAGDIWLIADQDAITRVFSDGKQPARIYIGQCGWSVQQMQSEISRKLWTVSPADADVVFDGHTQTLWTRLSLRVGR